MEVSIMITCYNIEDCIDAAVNSVMVQYMPFEWELLIGDDGSNDGTYEKVLLWQEKHPSKIKVFQMSRNDDKEKTGYRASRNRTNLLKKAKGKYLIFLDGDDMFSDPYKINTQVNFLKDIKYKDCSCCAHNILVNQVETSEQFNLEKKIKGNRVLSFEEYWKDYYFHPNTILFKRECVSIMLDSLYSDYLNDNFITYLILQHGNVLYLDKTMAVYNITGEGLWTGHKRIYGVFRNLKLYDLELRINPKKKNISFIRHISDFNYVFSFYLRDDMDIIRPLFECLDQNIFPISSLLLYSHDAKGYDKIKLFILKIRTRLVLRYCQIKYRINTLK